MGRTGLRFGAVLLGIIGATYVIAPEPRAMPIPHYRYDLVLSENDTLCRPITILYNQMLSTLVSAVVAGEYDNRDNRPDADRPYTDFEVAETNKFAAIGLVLPPLANETTGHRAGGFEDFYTATFFNEAKPRLVLIGDEWVHNFITTSVKILKKNATDPNEVDPRGNLPAGHIAAFDEQSYLLRKWPGFDRTYSEFLRSNKSLSYFDRLPVIVGYVTSRLFLFHDAPYFVLNRYVDLRGAKGRENSLIVVYRILDAGPDDICYLSLAPSTLSPHPPTTGGPR